MLAQTATPGGGLSSGAIVAIIIVALIVIGLFAYAMTRRRSRRLQDRFGPEYGRAVTRTGSRTQAERELEARERRHQQLDIRPLTPGARARYAEEWRTIQARFVDDPPGAVREADRVIVEVMRDRGYPVDDPAQRMDDLSVEHATVVDNYRTARAIAARNARNEASTEDLRQATVSYRALFEDLLGNAETRQPVTKGMNR